METKLTHINKKDLFWSNANFTYHTFLVASLSGQGCRRLPIRLLTADDPGSLKFLLSSHVQSRKKDAAHSQPSKYVLTFDSKTPLFSSWATRKMGRKPVLNPLLFSVYLPY